MNVIRYQPFRTAALFDELLRGFFVPSVPAGAGPTAATAAAPMRVDITEQDGTYRVSAELPGFKKEDIQVTVKDGVLNIAAELKSESEKTEGTRVVYRERRASSYARSFRLGDNVNLDGATAKFENGVLELTLPKSQVEEPKRISVH